MKPIDVLGHRNPDTDAIASALGYAWLLTQIEGWTYRAGRLGPVNAQTAFALRRFNVDAPPTVADVRPHAADVTINVPPLLTTDPASAAVRRLADSSRPLPVVNEQQPVGFISGAGVFRQLVGVLTDPPALAAVLAQPISAMLEPAEPVLHAADNISDLLPAVLRSEADDFAVVDEAGHYVGVCHKVALLNPPRRQLVLVDHNEPDQAAPGLEEAEILEILDHHRLNAPPTSLPIRLQIEPVGSCSTLVYERSREAGQLFPPELAGLLLCGVLSDTLHFRSPTTTPRDYDAALGLAIQAELVAEPLPPDAGVLAAIAELAAALLAAGAGLKSRPAREIVRADVKLYPVNDTTISIAQAEVTAFAELDDQRAVLLAALEDQRAADNLALALLLVTNIVTGDSRLLAAGPPRWLAALPYPRRADGTFDAPGVVSRKKQLLPAVLAALTA